MRPLCDEYDSRDGNSTLFLWTKVLCPSHLPSEVLPCPTDPSKPILVLCSTQADACRVTHATSLRQLSRRHQTPARPAVQPNLPRPFLLPRMVPAGPSSFNSEALAPLHGSDQASFMKCNMIRESDHRSVCQTENVFCLCCSWPNLTKGRANANDWHDVVEQSTHRLPKGSYFRKLVLKGAGPTQRGTT